MRSLQVTLFVIGFIVIGTQTFRHIYVKFLEPQSSVLDQYGDTTDESIASAQTLEDLVVLYEEAAEAVREYERDPSVVQIPIRERSGMEPYRSEGRLRAEIMRWEAQSNGIRKVRFYWTFGLLGVFLGLICFVRFNRWIGMAAVIGGFMEMAFWTSPLLRIPGATAEFERLLNHRLGLSLVTWALLLLVWLLVERRRPKTPGFTGHGTGEIEPNGSTG